MLTHDGHDVAHDHVRHAPQVTAVTENAATPPPWTQEEIDDLVELVRDQDTAATPHHAAWTRDRRGDDPYEGELGDSQAIFVVNLGDRPGYLETDDLSSSYMIVNPATRVSDD